MIINFRGKSTKSPFHGNDKLLLGSYYMGSRFSAECSLRYLDFISKIIGKSCKSASSIINFLILFSYSYLLLL